MMLCILWRNDFHVTWSRDQQSAKNGHIIFVFLCFKFCPLVILDLLQILKIMSQFKNNIYVHITAQMQ